MVLQPSLPPEVPFTEAEKNFMEESPPGLFPDNQNSNFGIKRKIFTDQMQEVINQLDTIYNERFITSSNTFLDEWERMLQLPMTPTGFDVAKRRAFAQARFYKGLFLRSRIASIVELFLNVVSGDVIQLTPEGVPLVVAGTPIYAEPGPLSQFYRIYENPDTYSYEVWIRSDVGIDPAGLLRELVRASPSGYTPTVDITHPNVNDYLRVVRNDGPTLRWKLDESSGATTVVNSSSLGATLNGTASGVTFGGASLLNAAVANIGTSGNFDGTNDEITLIHQDILQPTRQLTFEAWIKPDVVNTNKFIASKGTMALLVTSTAKVQFFITDDDSVTHEVNSATSLVAGTTYHIVATYDGYTLKLYLNGVLDASTAVPGLAVIGDSGNSLFVGSLGGSLFFDGVIDEFALYSFPLSATRVKEHYNTGTNVP